MIKKAFPFISSVLLVIQFATSVWYYHVHPEEMLISGIDSTMSISDHQDAAHCHHVPVSLHDDCVLRVLLQIATPASFGYALTGIQKIFTAPLSLKKGILLQNELYPRYLRGPPSIS